MNELLSGEMMVGKAKQMRERAQDRIVLAFVEQLQGRGAGPTDEDLQCFARLALVEETLNRSARLRPAAIASVVSLQPWGAVAGRRNP